MTCAPRRAGGGRLVEDLRHEDGAVLAERDAAVRRHAPRAPSAAASEAPEPAPLLLDEGAGPGAARLVHGGVHDAPALEPDVLRVLPANLEDGVDARVVGARALGVRGNLVQDVDALRRRSRSR